MLNIALLVTSSSSVC